MPSFGRQAFHKDVFQKPPRTVNDDVWTFNTQSSTQCMFLCIPMEKRRVPNRIAKGDGLRHFAYQKEKMFYNGVTLEDIHSSKESSINGIHGNIRPGVYPL